jgi:hypothetical protein
MLPWQRRVGPNEQAVAARVIDGEAIIINLKTGVYYSTDNVGATLWELVEQRRSLQEMVQAIVARYWVPREQAESDVQRLMAELIQEDLVSLSDGDGARTEPAAALAPGRAAYDPPRLDIYRDMGDLLALDPPAPGFEQTPWEKDGSR